jgi:uncharacterized membrane protein
MSWKSIFSIAAVFLIFDYIFLTKIFNKMWDNQITLIQGSGPDGGGKKVLVIMFVYFVMIAASYIFVVKNYTKFETIWYGALLGLAMYGVFDGTNYVLFKDYKLETVFIDTIYGMTVTSMACYIGSVWY